MFVLGLTLFGCDDTGKAIKEEVKEVDQEQVKRDIKDAGRKVEAGAKRAADETGKVIDKVDKKVAEEIRKD
jgi:ribosomal protein L7/L12